MQRASLIATRKCNKIQSVGMNLPLPRSGDKVKRLARHLLFRSKISYEVSGKLEQLAATTQIRDTLFECDRMSSESGYRVNASSL